MQRSKGKQDKTKRNRKQAKRQKQNNQTTHKTHTKPNKNTRNTTTTQDPLLQVRQVRRVRQGPHRTGEKRIYEALERSKNAPRARNSGELWIRKLPRLTGKIRSATAKPNKAKTKTQTKQNQPISQVKRKNGETSAGLRQNLTRMHRHASDH